MEELYSGGVDMSNNGDVPVVIIGRRNRDRVDIIKMLSGEAALELYNKYIHEGVKGETVM